MQRRELGEGFISLSLVSAIAIPAVTVALIHHNETNPPVPEEKPNPDLLDWNRANPSRSIFTTSFVFMQNFSRGNAFSGEQEENPIYFPFKVKVNRLAVLAFRERFSSVLPQSAQLKFLTLPQKSERHLPSSTDNSHKTGTSFEALAKDVYDSKFSRDRLPSKKTKQDFARDIEKKITEWMLQEIHALYYLRMASQQEFDPENERIQQLASEFGKEQVKKITEAQRDQIAPPIVLEVYDNFDYASHYQKPIAEIA